MRKILLVAVMLALAAARTGSKPARRPKIERAEGVVTALSEGEITLAEAGGKVDVIKLPSRLDRECFKADHRRGRITPGSYIGATNYAKARRHRTIDRGSCLATRRERAGGWTSSWTPPPTTTMTNGGRIHRGEKRRWAGCWR